VTSQPYLIRLNGLPLRLSGAGRLEMTAVLGLRESMQALLGREVVEVKLCGTLEEPRLDWSAIADGAEQAELARAVETHLLQLRQRQQNQMLETSARKVENMLETLERVQNQPTPCNRISRPEIANINDLGADRCDELHYRQISRPYAEAS